MGSPFENGFLSIIVASHLDDTPKIKELKISKEMLEDIKPEHFDKLVHRELDRMLDIMLGRKNNE